jgi:hypothetical protein
MKAEFKKIGVSFVDIFLSVLLMLIGVNLLLLTMGKFFSNPYPGYSFLGNWLYTIVMPVFFGVGISHGQPKSTFIITEIDDVDDVLSKIEKLIVQKNFRLKSKSTKQINFERKSFFGRFYDFFLREAYCIKWTNDTIVITSKRGILQLLAWKIEKQIINERKQQ